MGPGEADYWKKLDTKSSETVPLSKIASKRSTVVLHLPVVQGVVVLNLHNL